MKGPSISEVIALTVMTHSECRRVVVVCREQGIHLEAWIHLDSEYGKREFNLHIESPDQIEPALFALIGCLSWRFEGES